MGNLGDTAFGDDVKVKDRIKPALSMRFGGGGRHCSASERAAAESNDSWVLVFISRA